MPRLSESGQAPGAGNRATPRYEYRVFAPDLGRWDRRLDTELRRSGESEEKNLYLTGLGRVDVNFKIRDGRLEVKRLLGIEQGLEQWQPDPPRSFPLSPRALSESAGLEAECDLDIQDFMARVLRPSGPASAMHVLKRRVHYEGEGILGESCRLVINGARLQSVAVEGAQPGRVCAMVRALKMGGPPGTDLPNTSYPRALAWLAGVLRLPADSPWRAAEFG